MKWRQSYHLACLFPALLLAFGQPLAAQESQVSTAEIRLPPRTIDDVVRLLDHFKPDPAVAAKAQEAATALAPPDASRAELFEFYLQRGRANAKIGRIDQQIADLKQAADLGEPAGLPRVRALRELASAEATGGNLLNAARYADEAASQVPANAAGNLLGILQAATYYHFVLADFPAARERLQQAEAVFARLRSSKGWLTWRHTWTATIERARAEIFRADGRFVEAEGAFRKAIAANEAFLVQLRGGGIKDADPEMLERSQHYAEILERSLGSTLLAQGKLAESEVFVRRALQRSLERVGRASTDVAIGLGLLSSVLAEQGRAAEASRLAQEALLSYQQAGAAEDSMFVSTARKNLGSALVAQGRYGEAASIFVRNREALKNNPELLRKVGSGHTEWVIALLRTGDQAAAERMSRSMYEWAAKRYGEADSRVAFRRAFVAMTVAERGDYPGALALFRASVPQLLAQARDDVEAETGTLRKQRYLIIILESYLRALASAGTGTPETLAESFRIADIARSSIVQRALTAAAARANIADPRLADMARREQDAQRRGNALSELLTQLLSAPPEQQLAKVQETLRRDIAELKKQRDALRKEIVAGYPDYAELVAPQPVTLERARASLRPGEALVAFYLGEQESYVWALNARGEARFAMLGQTRQAVAKAIAQLRAALDPGVEGIEEMPAYDVAAAHALYSRLLAPVAEVWGGASLLLAVPHGELGTLPLAVLPTAAVAPPAKEGELFAGYRNVPWLVRQLAIEQLPSVTALTSLRRLPARLAASASFAGFGDPLFSVEQAKAAVRQLATRGGGQRGARLGLRNLPTLGQVESASLSLLPRLPDTGIEVQEIARTLHADPQRDVFLQKEATERRVMEMDLSGKRVIMFATHGLVPGDLDGLTQPALALTSPEVAPAGGSGLLTMEEVLSLKLDADWVVLSACNTAAGEGAGAEAVSGLGRAFFYAGARALLVSNWPVETVAARLLMTEMFRLQGAEPALLKAEALRRSMLSLMDGPGARDGAGRRTLYTYAHPLFWAPFVIVGD